MISFDRKYCCISVDIDKKQLKLELTHESIGIDIGIKDLAICSNTMTFKNINKSKEVKILKKVLKVSRKYEQYKIKGGESFSQYKKTNNIIKLEKRD